MSLSFATAAGRRVPCRRWRTRRSLRRAPTIPFSIPTFSCNNVRSSAPRVVPGTGATVPHRSRFDSEERGNGDHDVGWGGTKLGDCAYPSIEVGGACSPHGSTTSLATPWWNPRASQARCGPKPCRVGLQCGHQRCCRLDSGIAGRPADSPARPAPVHSARHWAARQCLWPVG